MTRLPPGNPCDQHVGTGPVRPEAGIRNSAGAVAVWGGVAPGVWGPVAALHWGGRALNAPTALRCSVLRPVAELAARRALTALKQPRRACQRTRCALAASPVLLVAPEARRDRPPQAFAAATWCSRFPWGQVLYCDIANENWRAAPVAMSQYKTCPGPSPWCAAHQRPSVAAGGARWRRFQRRAEEHRRRGGARSALRDLTHRALSERSARRARSELCDAPRLRAPQVRRRVQRQTAPP